MSKVAAAELARALGAKETGPDQWQAQCPYHDDKSPSLSIGTGEDGRVLVHCHAGCECVFERLVADGYLGPRTPTQAEGEVEACYRYLDPSGQLTFEVLRLEGKKFRARRPAGDGGWSWDVPEDLRVPYRLPELLGAPQDNPVFIVEGEKDADRLGALGYVATTNPFGAGKWRQQYNRFFVGRHVVIVPDNDEPGRKHAEQVRQQLQVVAASVRVVSLAGVVQDKGDLSDLIEAQGVEAVERVLADVQPPDLRDKPYLSITELAQLPRRQWLVEGLLPKQGISLLYGDSGMGKTFVAIDISARIAAGEPALGRLAASGLVFYVAMEGQSGLYDRIRAVADEIGLGDVSRLPFVVRAKPLNLCSSDSVADLIAGVRHAAASYDASPALVVIDTLSRAMAGANENSPDAMMSAVNALAHIQGETGAAVLVIHHSGKNEERGARGHSSLRAAVDAELLVSRDQQARTLTVTKQRDGADQLKILFDLAPKPVPTPEGDGSSETRVVRLLEVAGDGPTLNLSRSSAAALRALKEALRTSGRRLSDEEAGRLKIPVGVRVVTRDEWLEVCRAAGISKGGDDAVRKARNRAAKELRKAGLLQECGDFCWLSRDGDPPPPGQETDDRTGQDRPRPEKKKKGKARASRDRTGHPPMGVSVCPARDSPLIDQRQ